MITKLFEVRHGQLMANREIATMEKRRIQPAVKTGNVIMPVLLIFLAGFLSACGGSKLIKNPKPIEPASPLEVAVDQRVKVTLQWVIVRNGPGTWASYANWDEYLLSFANQTGEAIQITGAHIVDSMGFQHTSDSNRGRLVNASKETVKRYKTIDISINAGYAGGTALIAAGVGAGYLANAALDAAVGAALMNGATATGTMTIVASTALVVAPILIVGGIMQGVNNHKVTTEIGARHTALPVTVAPNATRRLDLFFPLAPSPQRIDIGYSGSFGERVISLDTTEVLDGLHIVPFRIHEEDLPANL